MKESYESMKRHIHNDLRAIEHRLNSGRRRGVKETQRLIGLAEAMTRTLDNLEREEHRSDYSDSKIGYNPQRKHSPRHTRYAIHDVVDTIHDLLPHISPDVSPMMPHDDYDMDMDMYYYDDFSNVRRRGRGVPKPGRPADRRFKRNRPRRHASYTHDAYDAYDDHDHDDFHDEMESRRRHYRRGRRADMDIHDTIHDAVDDAMARHRTHPTHTRITHPHHTTHPHHPTHAESRHTTGEAESDASDVNPSGVRRR